MTNTEVLIIGAGPAGATAAIHAAQAGFSTLLIDAKRFPRDKTCGDGLTPRAITQLKSLGLAETVCGRYTSHGLKLHGYGSSTTVPWPESEFGTVGSAMPRLEFDQLLLTHAASYEQVTVKYSAAVGVELTGNRITSVTLHDGTQVLPKYVIVADGVRSTFGKLLGRVWHKGEVYGIAARSYCTTPLSEEPWIHSHVELRDQTGVIQPGYGWIFPLGTGHANVGCGALSTDARPAKINTKKVLEHYVAVTNKQWEFGPPQQVTSALLPMGGAVSNVAGSNWMLIGDAAACVNPLNGEGIDYGMETAALAVATLDPGKDFTLLWPDILRRHYGEAFLLARTAARLLTYPQFLPLVGPVGLKLFMPTAARLMGNLVTDDDRDVVARLWRGAGRIMDRFNNAPLWS